MPPHGWCARVVVVVVGVDCSTGVVRGGVVAAPPHSLRLPATHSTPPGLCCVHRFMLCVVIAQPLWLWTDSAARRQQPVPGEMRFARVAATVDGTSAQCAAACLSEPTCVSFEWASEGGGLSLNVSSVNELRGWSQRIPPPWRKLFKLEPLREARKRWSKLNNTWQPSNKDHPHFHIDVNVRPAYTHRVSFALILAPVPSRLSSVGSFMCGRG